MAHLKIVVGVLVLTVTVLLNTRPAEAANCTDASDCKNSGTCPDTTAPCNCSASLYVGDTCEDACTDGGTECKNGGTCNATDTAFVCTCATGYSGLTCGNGAFAVAGFSLMSLLVVLTRYLL